MAKTSVSLAVCICFINVVKGAESYKPVVNCPLYHDDGAVLDCECRPPSPELRESTITWPGHSDTPRLQIEAVSRRDDGKIYTCQMVWKSHIYRTDYTLHVAYGPADDTMHIDGPAFFITEGTKNLTLTCRVREVNPKPLITWLFQPCNHGRLGETCTFTPNPSRQHKKKITCRAVNSYTGKVTSGKATFVLRIKNPPKTAPVISGHSEGQIHKAGDNITCTVTGGKPLVHKVSFFCTNPSYKDKVDVTEEHSVSSSLTVMSTELREYETVCTCSAVWKPDPNMYTLNTSISFATLPEIEGGGENVKVGEAQVVQDKDGQSGLSGSAVAALVLGICLGIVLIACIILWKLGLITIRKRRHVVTEEHVITHPEDDVQETFLEETATEEQPLFGVPMEATEDGLTVELRGEEFDLRPAGGPEPCLASSSSNVALANSGVATSASDSTPKQIVSNSSLGQAKPAKHISEAVSLTPQPGDAPNIQIENHPPDSDTEHAPNSKTTTDKGASGEETTKLAVKGRGQVRDAKP